MRKYKEYIDIVLEVTLENISKDIDVIIKDIQDNKMDTVIIKLQELKDRLN